MTTLCTQLYTQTPVHSMTNHGLKHTRLQPPHSIASNETVFIHTYEISQQTFHLQTLPEMITKPLTLQTPRAITSPHRRRHKISNKFLLCYIMYMYTSYIYLAKVQQPFFLAAKCIEYFNQRTSTPSALRRRPQRLWHPTSSITPFTITPPHNSPYLTCITDLSHGTTPFLCWTRKSSQR